MAVQQTQILPAPFIEAAGKTYLDDLSKAAGSYKAADLSQVFGPSFVAGQSGIQAEAEALRGGLGSYQPFLTTASALTGPTAYQAYMSPYQQDVIDTTLQDYDIQAQKGLGQIAEAAITSGAFGGGRQGVAEAEYRAASDRNRAAIQAQLLQQGFGQAQNLASQDFTKNLQLASQSPALAGQQIAGLTTIGGAQTGREQAGLTADQQLAQQKAFQDLTAAQQFGSGVTQLIAGYPGRENVLPATPAPLGLATGLGTASTLAGIYRLINPAPTVIKTA